MPFILEGNEMRPFTTSIGSARDIYRIGTGPAVIIDHEIPGINPLLRPSAARSRTEV